MMKSSSHGKKNQETSIRVRLTILVGGFNPSEKYARQIGSFPQIGMKINNIWNHQLVIYWAKLLVNPPAKGWALCSWVTWTKPTPKTKGVNSGYKGRWSKDLPSIFIYLFIKVLLLNGTLVGKPCKSSRPLKNNTLPETNISPENGWLEHYFPIGEAYFQGLR